MRVWCDMCGKPLSGGWEFEGKNAAEAADKAALAAGWTVVKRQSGETGHLCPPCDVKAVADAEARGLVFVPMEVN